MYRYQGGNSVLLWPPLRTNSCSTILVASASAAPGRGNVIGVFAAAPPLPLPRGLLRQLGWLPFRHSCAHAETVDGASRTPSEDTCTGACGRKEQLARREVREGELTVAQRSRQHRLGPISYARVGRCGAASRGRGRPWLARRKRRLARMPLDPGARRGCCCVLWCVGSCGRHSRGLQVQYHGIIALNYRCMYYAVRVIVLHKCSRILRLRML